MLSTLKSYCTFSWSQKPNWITVLNKKDNFDSVTKYLSAEDIGNWRCASKSFRKLVDNSLERNTRLCFRIDESIDTTATKKDIAYLGLRSIRLKNVKKVSDVEGWLKKMNTKRIAEVELLDCILSWMDVLRVLYLFENLQTLKIISNNEEFSSLELSGDDDKKFELFKLDDVSIVQALPLDILKHKQRKLEKFIHDSNFENYSATLLRILHLKYLNLKECHLRIGSSDNIHVDHRSIPHLFTSLVKLLTKNAETLEKLSVDTYSTLGDIEKNQRMFFNEFSRCIVQTIKTPLKALKDIYLNFPNPNFEIDDNRNRLRRFLASVPGLKNMFIGPVQMKLQLEDFILGIVPKYVNCHFSGIYLFQNAPRNLVTNNKSFSDVSFTLARTSPEIKDGTFTHMYNFKNYHPIENINFSKTTICQNLPFMTKLLIEQDPKNIDENDMLCIQDHEMQQIISRGTALVSLTLKCNLKLLTDGGLVGLTKAACEKIIEEFAESNDSELLKSETLHQLHKAGLGLSFCRLAKLEDLTLEGALENVSDAFAIIALCNMKSLKSVSVRSPRLTTLGELAMKNKCPAKGFTVVWTP